MCFFESGEEGRQSESTARKKVNSPSEYTCSETVIGGLFIFLVNAEPN